MTDKAIIAAFEDTIAGFLEQRLSTSNNLTIANYNVSVISQEILQKRRILEESVSDYLIVTTSLMAKGTPAKLATKFPFQAAAHSVIKKNSDELFEEIYTSALKELESPSSTSGDTKSVDMMSSSNATKLKNIAVGSSIAGAAVLISLVTILLIQHRRGNGLQACANNDSPPPTHYATAFAKEEEVSSIEDSLLSISQVPVTHTNRANQSIDQWSLEDNSPVPREGSKLHACYDKTTVVKNDHNSSHIKAFAVMDTSEESNWQTNNGDSSSQASVLKQVSFVAMDEPTQSKELLDLPQPDQSLTRLYEQAMPGEDIESPATSAPQPSKVTPGFKLFSCFADNTFEDMPTHPTKLTAKKILQNQYKSSSTPTASNHDHNVYEVQAPPGPLGIIIDSSDEGPFIYDVKQTSPLHGQVQTGDAIISIDGWCCEQRSAHDVANWIKKKPKTNEQVLVLKGKRDCADEESV